MDAPAQGLVRDSEGILNEQANAVLFRAKWDEAERYHHEAIHCEP
jgi:hypothetical protein